VEYARLDFTDPRTYGPALAGLEQVFLIRPPQIAQARYFRVTDTVQKLLGRPPSRYASSCRTTGKFGLRARFDLARRT
jgi:hypothetical protein